METLKYKVIKSREQYDEYCNMLEELVTLDTQDQEDEDEMELLTYLIEKWDQENNSFFDAEPITLLNELMAERNLKPKDLAEILGVSKGLVSNILNYKKGLSKEVIRSLATYFKVSQETFNREYNLKLEAKPNLKNVIQRTQIYGPKEKEHVVRSPGHGGRRVTAQSETIKVAGGGSNRRIRNKK